MTQKYQYIVVRDIIHNERAEYNELNFYRFNDISDMLNRMNQITIDASDRAVNNKNQLVMACGYIIDSFEYKNGITDFFDSLYERIDGFGNVKKQHDVVMSEFEAFLAGDENFWHIEAVDIIEIEGSDED